MPKNILCIIKTLSLPLNKYSVEKTNLNQCVTMMSSGLQVRRKIVIEKWAVNLFHRKDALEFVIERL